MFQPHANLFSRTLEILTVEIISKNYHANTILNILSFIDIHVFQPKEKPQDNFPTTTTKKRNRHDKINEQTWK